LPLDPERYVVLELNGAVDFFREYSPRGDAFAAAMHALVRGRLPQPFLPALAEAGAW
jgi:hypothetical protein